MSIKYVDLGSTDISLDVAIPDYVYSSLRNTTFSGLMLSARKPTKYENVDNITGLGFNGLYRCLVFKYDGYEFYTYDLKKLYIKVSSELIYYVSVPSVYDFKVIILKFLVFRDIHYLELYDNLFHSVLPSPDVLLSSNYRDVYFIKSQEWYSILSNMDTSYSCTLYNGTDISINKGNHITINGLIFVDIADAVEYLIIKSI